MANQHDMDEAVAALAHVSAALPENPDLALEVLTFAIVEAAAFAGADRDDIIANIDIVLQARQAAARQVMS